MTQGDESDFMAAAKEAEDTGLLNGRRGIDFLNALGLDPDEWHEVARNVIDSIAFGRDLEDPVERKLAMIDALAAGFLCGGFYDRRTARS